MAAGEPPYYQPVELPPRLRLELDERLQLVELPLLRREVELLRELDERLQLVELPLLRRELELLRRGEDRGDPQPLGRPSGGLSTETGEALGRRALSARAKSVRAWS